MIKLCDWIIRSPTLLLVFSPVQLMMQAADPGPNVLAVQSLGTTVWCCLLEICLTAFIIILRGMQPVGLWLDTQNLGETLWSLTSVSKVLLLCSGELGLRVSSPLSQGCWSFLTHSKTKRARNLGQPWGNTPGPHIWVTQRQHIARSYCRKARHIKQMVRGAVELAFCGKLIKTLRQILGFNRKVRKAKQPAASS